VYSLLLMAVPTTLMVCVCVCVCVCVRGGGGGCTTQQLGEDRIQMHSRF